MKIMKISLLALLVSVPAFADYTHSSVTFKAFLNKIETVPYGGKLDNQTLIPVEYLTELKSPTNVADSNDYYVVTAATWKLGESTYVCNSGQVKCILGNDCPDLSTDKVKAKENVMSFLKTKKAKLTCEGSDYRLNMATSRVEQFSPIDIVISD